MYYFYYESNFKIKKNSFGGWGVGGGGVGAGVSEFFSQRIQI